MLNTYFPHGQLVLEGCGKALFKAECRENIGDIAAVLTEAEKQTVFALLFSAFEKTYDLKPYQNKFYSLITRNTKVIAEHKALYSLLKNSNIPVVFLKGCASARYYPDPLLRTLGDVDLLVHQADFQKAATLLKENGYLQTGTEDRIHIAFVNPKNRINVELHRNINGIPENEYGAKIATYFDDIFEKSVLDGNGYVRPSDFHHGLILLLHNAAHLTKEGLGLRHFCDWAVFVSHFENERFCASFEAPLKEAGLWQFARISTAFAVKYLGVAPMPFCTDVEDQLLESLCADILSGGNFGKKDFTRYQHIKYISNHDEHTPSRDTPIKRLFKNLNIKAKQLPLVKKAPWMLWAGYIAVIFQYIWLVILGRRKIDNKNLRSEAESRNTLYSSFDLFK